jgi:hypothetical protein
MGRKKRSGVSRSTMPMEATTLCHVRYPESTLKKAALRFL